MADAMDSKSISREGVGVQVPASAPVPHDELARALLPALLHRLNNVTQVIAGVNSLVRLTGDSAPLVRCAGDLEHAGGALERLGWQVHALARAMGSPIGAERREERALEWLVELVGEALRREGRDLALRGAFPRLPADCGFAECWALAGELHTAALAAPARTRLAWSARLEGERLVLDCEVAA
jgi:hypothetical protein